MRHKPFQPIRVWSEVTFQQNWTSISSTDQWLRDFDVPVTGGGSDYTGGRLVTTGGQDEQQTGLWTSLIFITDIRPTAPPV